jgi:hypothetical protein
MDSARVVLIKPGDVLLIGNVGELTDEAIQQAGPVVAALKDTLGLAEVLIFEADIDLAAVTPAQQAPSHAPERSPACDQAGEPVTPGD